MGIGFLGSIGRSHSVYSRTQLVSVYPVSRRSWDRGCLRNPPGHISLVDWRVSGFVHGRVAGDQKRWRVGTGFIAGVASLGDIGMEVYYAQYSPETIDRLARVAENHGLIPCGGSDYHGLGNTGELLPGTMGPPMETVERLEEASRKRIQSAI